MNRTLEKIVGEGNINRMDTTYQKMIMSVGSVPCQNNEFI